MPAAPAEVANHWCLPSKPAYAKDENIIRAHRVSGKTIQMLTCQLEAVRGPSWTLHTAHIPIEFTLETLEAGMEQTEAGVSCPVLSLNSFCLSDKYRSGHGFFFFFMHCYIEITTYYVVISI